MAKKLSESKKTAKKVCKSNRWNENQIKQRAKEFAEWKTKNTIQKRFFSLEEREQKLLETSYVVILQLCPELTREDYLKRLSIADNYSAKTKDIIKDLPSKILKI